VLLFSPVVVVPGKRLLGTWSTFVWEEKILPPDQFNKIKSEKNKNRNV
jgi:hypothetical protein